MNRFKILDSFTLKCIAMALMLCDHLWAVLPFNAGWLTAVGRLAFPIFAFQIAEGFARTSSRSRYLKRMLVFALISELPFNLFAGGALFSPFHQNVMFTFLIALLLMCRMEKARSCAPRWRYLLCCAGSGIVGFLSGFLLMVDYYGVGVLTVLVFYWTREKRLGWLWQLAALWWMNLEVLGGFGWPVVLGGAEIFLPQQGLALLALPLIWMYNGKQGLHSKTVQRLYYGFYPAHMLVLSLLSIFVW